MKNTSHIDSQCPCGIRDQIRIIGENTCKEPGKQKHDQPEAAGKNRADCKLRKNAFNTLFIAGTEIITHDRLSALAYSLQR